MAKRSKAIQAAVDRANFFFRTSPDEQKETREYLQAFVTSLLMDSHSYKGFNHLYWDNVGCEKWKRDGEPGDSPETFHLKEPYIYGPDGDKSRIFFY